MSDTKKSGPMRLDDIELVLVEASKICNHRSFVVAGSLSALGAVVVPPIDMVRSRDVDFYPMLDPERGFLEIAQKLGEDSAFSVEHGFFADPINPKILALPTGWESRLIPISLRSGVVAFFLNPADAAISKLVRSHDNDLRWVRAGLQEGIFDRDVLLARADDVPAASGEELRLCRRSIALLIGELSGRIEPSARGDDGLTR